MLNHFYNEVASLNIKIVSILGEFTKNSLFAEFFGSDAAKIGIIVLFSICIITIAVSLVYIYDPKWFSQRVTDIKAFLGVFGIRKIVIDYDDFEEQINSAGYDYDPEQDLFYSTMDAWQRNFGYCRLYDEMEEPLGGIIVDSEPIYFEYGDKKWLIEFWKGQYDMTTGCEIGIYNTTGPELNIPGVFNGTFYNCADKNDLLYMACTLRKNGEEILTRQDRHWWLTGFKLGEFSEPSELSMEIEIVLKNSFMRNKFWEGLNNAGYSDDEIYIEKNTIKFLFDKPRTEQPVTRNPSTDSIIQSKNEQLCTMYQEITRPYSDMRDKVDAIKRESPDLFKDITNMGKTKPMFKSYNKIKKYIKH